ncbi:hypothetical protein [Lactobacillus helveticus]|uniref:hypothetical protein n=2 Tax=Lactobacillus helveticus TaxID=1587 RepID=UPI0021A5459C|nr:hypothetical protein [Lactobacillus helveticus]
MIEKYKEIGMKKLITIFILVVVVLITGVLIFKNVNNTSKIILDAKVADDNYESIAFVNIYDNGKIVKCSSLKNRNFVRPIEVDPQVFEDHTSTNNSTYLTVNKKLLNKNKAVSSDPTWIRLIKNLAKRSKYLIAILSLFKLDHEYYIFIKYNAGLSDEGTLYKYDGKFKKVCTLDSNQIIALRKSN